MDHWSIWTTLVDWSIKTLNGQNFGLYFHTVIGKMLLNCPEIGQCFLFRLEESPAHICCQIDFHFVMTGVAVVLQQNKKYVAHTWSIFWSKVLISSILWHLSSGPYVGKEQVATLVMNQEKFASFDSCE